MGDRVWLSHVSYLLNECKIMLDSIQASFGIIYYADLMDTRGNFCAFKRFCHTYCWNQNSSQFQTHIYYKYVLQLLLNNWTYPNPFVLIGHVFLPSV